MAVVNVLRLELDGGDVEFYYDTPSSRVIITTKVDGTVTKSILTDKEWNAVCNMIYRERNKAR